MTATSPHIATVTAALLQVAIIDEMNPGVLDEMTATLRRFWTETANAATDRAIADGMELWEVIEAA